MADTSLIIGNGNWAVKETSLLGYNIIQSKYVPIEMTVSRNTTATRVNSAGFIEVVPINLLTYSNDLTNPIWTKTNTTIALNTIANPLNGLVNGQIFTPNTTNGDHIVYGSGTTIAGQSYVISFFVKANGYTNCRVGNAASGLGVWFNLSNGTVISGTGGTITPLSNGWYLASYLLTAGGTLVNPLISFAPSTSTNFAGNGISGGYVFGAQLETGTTATEYIPTTDRFNIPRVDYSTGTASLLVEPARTNIILYSEQFDNAAWVKNGGGTGTVPVVTSNAYISPNGSMDADKIDLACPTTGAPNWSWVYQSFTATLGLSYTFTVYLKAATPSDVGKIIRFGYTSYNNITLTADWKRYTNTAVAPSNTSFSAGFRLRGSETTVTTASFFAYGAQLEEGANATSYIPTLNLVAGVTRTADVISKTGVGSLIGQTEGTIFVEANLTANTEQRRIITIGTELQRIMFWTLGTTLRANFNAESVTIGTFPIGTAKMALAYTIAGGSTTYSIKLNNNTLITGTAAAAPSSLSAIYLGTNASSLLSLNDRIKSVQLYKTALSPGQLATLTAI